MDDYQTQPVKIAIVGTGNVGTTFAFNLLISGLAAEIVLIDKNQSRAEGEAMDLSHAVPLSRATRIWAGDYPDCSGAAVTVVTAGSAQKPGESRLDLLQRNAAIIHSIIEAVVENNPKGLLLIATNPVDVLTYASWKYSGLPSERVIGSGTILDTARFRHLLSQYYQVDSRSVHAYIIGEHGDSEVPVWSLANIAGMRLLDFCALNNLGCNQVDMDTIFHQTRDAAYHIIERKGATYYAVASGLVRIIESILRNENSVLTVSSHIDDYLGIKDVCLSLPTIVGRSGIQRLINIELSDQELEGLYNSANLVKKTIGELKLH